MNRPLFAISVPSRRLRGIEKQLARIATALEALAPPKGNIPSLPKISEDALYQGLSPEAVRARVHTVIKSAQAQGLSLEDLEKAFEDWEPEVVE